MAFIRRIVLSAIAAIVLFGCGGPTTIGDDPTDPNGCTDDTASIGFNSPPGFSGSMDLTSIDTCFTLSNYSTKAQTTVIAGPPFTGDPSQPPDPTIKVWLYLSYQFAMSEFLVSLPDVHVTVPGSILAPGRTFFLGYDTNDVPPPFTWFQQPYDPETPVGNALFFPGISPQVSAVHDDLYQFVLYSSDQPVASSLKRTPALKRTRSPFGRG
jgi:hypothetical protein